jgi:hypothetical protein
MAETVAVVNHFGLRDDQDCCKEFKIGKTAHKRYSRKAVERIKTALKEESAEEIWKKRGGKERRVG